MKLGAYTACLHDLPVAAALADLRDLGLDTAEINSRGFLPAADLPIGACARVATRGRTTWACSPPPASPSRR